MKYKFLKAMSFLALATLGFVDQAKAMRVEALANLAPLPDMQTSDLSWGRWFRGLSKFGGNGLEWEAEYIDKERERALSFLEGALSTRRSLIKLITNQEMKPTTLIKNHDQALAYINRLSERILEFPIKVKSKGNTFKSALEHHLQPSLAIYPAKTAIESFAKILKDEVWALKKLYDMADYAFTHEIFVSEDNIESYFGSEVQNYDMTAPMQAILNLDNFKLALSKYLERIDLFRGMPQDMPYQKPQKLPFQPQD